MFPFERYNGILEGINKSWVLPEKQMFRKLLGMQKVKQTCSSQASDDDFLPYFINRHSLALRTDHSSLGQTVTCDSTNMQHM